MKDIVKREPDVAPPVPNADALAKEKKADAIPPANRLRASFEAISKKRALDKEKIDKEFAEGRIEIIPFAFMRGRNFSNSFIILDEAQNITDSQGC